MSPRGKAIKINNDIDLLSKTIIFFVSETFPISNLKNLKINQIHYSNIGIFIDIEGVEFDTPPSDRSLLGTRALIEGDLAEILLHYSGLVPDQIEIFFQDGRNLEGGWNRRIDQLLLQGDFD